LTLRWIISRLLIVILLVAHSILLGAAAINNSATIDEVAHLPAGLSHWMTGRFELYKVNPPLVRMTAAVPVLLMNPVTNWDRIGGTYHPSGRSEFSVGGDFYWRNRDRAALMFTVARMACIPFCLLGLWTCHVWARDLYGEAAGLLAAGLWAFSPMVLGHGSLITADVAGAATGIAAMYRFRCWLLMSGLRNIALLGLAAGMALLTKSTWAVLFPVIALTTLPLWRQREWLHFAKITRDAGQLGMAVLVALAVVNVAYGFDGTGTRIGKIPFFSSSLGVVPPSKFGIPAEKYSWPGLPNRFSESWIGALPLPLPVQYVRGMDLQKRDFEPATGHNSYLLGERPSHNGWWYWYLAGTLVKVPLPTLILGSVAFGMSVWARPRNGSGAANGEETAGPPVRPAVSIRELAVLLIPPATVYVLTGSQSLFTDHMRYVLPAFPFAYVFISQVAVSAIRSRAVAGLIAVSAVWQISSVLYYAPHWLSYFNEIAGGPENGYRWLAGSNISWGQDLLELKQWRVNHPEVEPLSTVVFTNIPPEAMGWEISEPPPFVVGKPEERNRRGQRGPQPGWHAIDVNALAGTLTLPGTLSGNSFRYFEHFQPFHRIGYSINIYHVTEAEANRVRRILEAEEAVFLSAGDSKNGPQ